MLSVYFKPLNVTELCCLHQALNRVCLRQVLNHVVCVFQAYSNRIMLSVYFKPLNITELCCLHQALNHVCLRQVLNHVVCVDRPCVCVCVKLTVIELMSVCFKPAVTEPLNHVVCVHVFKICCNRTTLYVC